MFVYTDVRTDGRTGGRVQIYMSPHLKDGDIQHNTRILFVLSNVYDYIITCMITLAINSTIILRVLF